MRIFNVGKVNFIECIIIENLHSHLSSAHLYFLPFIFREPLSLKIREKKRIKAEKFSVGTYTIDEKVNTVNEQ